MILINHGAQDRHAKTSQTSDRLTMKKQETNKQKKIFPEKYQILVIKVSAYNIITGFVTLLRIT